MKWLSMFALPAASAVLCIAAGTRVLTAVAASEHWQANGYSSGEIQLLHDGVQDGLHLSTGTSAVRSLAIIDNRYLAVGQGSCTTVFDLDDGSVSSTQQGLLEGTALKHDYHFALRTGVQPALLFYSSWKGSPAFEQQLKGPVSVQAFQFSPAKYEGYDERFVVIAFAPAVGGSRNKAVIRMFDILDHTEVREFATAAPDEMGRWSNSGNAYEVFRPEVGLPKTQWKIARRFFLQTRSWQSE